MGFSQALSGLNAAASSLDVQGNNIANSQTVGFKSSSTQFADVFASSQVGLGTRVSTVLQDFSAGNLEATGRNLDLGISGEGFFRFQQAGEVVYSRNGQLTMTADGFLQNAQGARIMGYGVNEAGAVQSGGQPEVLRVDADEMPASATQNVNTVFNLDSREVPGKGLDTARLTDADGNRVDVDYHYSNNFTVYDSLGNAVNTTVYYEKVGGPESQNIWQAKVAADGEYSEENSFLVEFNSNGAMVGMRNITDDYTVAQQALKGELEVLIPLQQTLAGATKALTEAQEAETAAQTSLEEAQAELDQAVADGLGAGDPAYDDALAARDDAQAELTAAQGEVATATTDRDAAQGDVDAAQADVDAAEQTMLAAFNAIPVNQQKQMTFDAENGAEPIVFDFDPAGSTQFGNTSAATELTQDGYTSGALVGITIENDGTVVRNYSNEQSRAAGQIVMANFRNPEGLSPQGDNAWAATAASGQELIGAAGTGLLGTIESGTIETSNVDMARELVNMIVTQRSYQANSQTIKTQDEVLQTAINLR